jgi:hypothetical protein
MLATPRHEIRHVCRQESPRELIAQPPQASVNHEVRHDRE